MRCSSLPHPRTNLPEALRLAALRYMFCFVAPMYCGSRMNAPPPPPSDVAKIEPDIRGATTIRAQLAKHRDTPACMSCHTVIDPPGFALETFDVIGGWRER